MLIFVPTDLVEAESVGNSVVLSFPMHLASNHRIEITVTRWNKNSYMISDSARTLGEIEAAGYKVTSHMMERIEIIASASGLRVADTHFILESSLHELGASIQKFLEITKTIGDVYPGISDERMRTIN